MGYATTKSPLLISPHNIGIPQRRERIFIPCIRKDLLKENEEFEIKIPYKEKRINLIEKWSSEPLDDKLVLSEYHKNVIMAWREFTDNISKSNLNFSIWSDYWFVDQKLIDSEPKWKLPTIQKNREFYLANKSKIDRWYKKHSVSEFYPTHRKFEWSVGREISFDESLLQFRPSGLRASSPFLHPTITTIINQTAIIPSTYSKVSIQNLLGLQSFPKKMKLPDNYGQSVKLIGNAVNVDVASTIINIMKQYDR